MEAWVGPAIVAAVISGLVSLIVVQLGFRAERRAERLRRDEKVRDFQIALRAEIASDLINMKETDRSRIMAEMTAAFAADPAYSPVAPRIASNLIFEAIVREIHILPEGVISPIVHYARLRQTLERFVDDLRSETYRALNAERRLLAYSDYLATYDRLETLAQTAMRSLELSIGINRSGADPSIGEPGKDAASPGTFQP